MHLRLLSLAVVVIILTVPFSSEGCYYESDDVVVDEESLAAAYIEKVDRDLGVRRNRGALAEWQYASNLTDYNNDNLIKVTLELAKEDKKVWDETIKYNWKSFQNETLKRMFQKYSVLGPAALPAEKQERLTTILSAMQSNYAKATICDYKNPKKCDLSLQPDVVGIFANSEDPAELKSAWVQWYQEAGAKVKSNFTEYVKLSNEVAVANNYTDYAQYWIVDYEDDYFEKELARLWNELKPLYLQIHAYVRKRLWDKYGNSVLSRTGPIPAHLLGNVWAQAWVNVERFTKPYPNKEETSFTAALVEQKYTPLKMFQTADEFFQSMNLLPMPELFWQNSILEKPSDGRDLVCHASAWDFSDGKDFRIKQCTTVDDRDFQTVHHEMGHIEYYMLYKDQPTIFRSGANPGFHEAIGDVIALSVGTVKHLRKIGLMPEGVDDAQAEINKLFYVGMDKIVFLPFAYMLDTYRYSIFRGKTTPDNYNCHFWNLREELQGIEPPVERNETQFDAGAKYHVSADVEYARYYVSFIIQFQFYRSLCQIAGEYAPNDSSKKLTNCDFYQSTAAGDALSEMLKMGSSKPWQDAMEMATGQRKMDSSGILEYFKPLQTWLEKENKKTGEKIGWDASKVRYCTDAQKAALKGVKYNNKVTAKPAVTTKVPTTVPPKCPPNNNNKKVTTKAPAKNAPGCQKKCRKENICLRHGNIRRNIKC